MKNLIIMGATLLVASFLIKWGTLWGTLLGLICFTLFILEILDYKFEFSKICPIYEKVLEAAFYHVPKNLHHDMYCDIIRLCKYRARRIKSGYDLHEEIEKLKRDLNV